MLCSTGTYRSSTNRTMSTKSESYNVVQGSYARDDKNELLLFERYFSCLQPYSHFGNSSLVMIPCLFLIVEFD